MVNGDGRKGGEEGVLLMEERVVRENNREGQSDLGEKKGNVRGV